MAKIAILKFADVSKTDIYAKMLITTKYWLSGEKKCLTLLGPGEAQSASPCVYLCFTFALVRHLF